MYDFDTPIHRAGTDSVKWDLRESLFGRGDALPMWVADTDFTAPPEVLEALADKLRTSPALGYGVPPADYAPALAEWLRTRHSWEVREEWIRPAGGVLVSIAQALLALTEPGDRVMVHTPVYDPFYRLIEQNGRRIVRCSTATGRFGRWELDYERIERELRAGVRAMLFCNPHNPTGRVWTPEELAQLGTLCAHYGALVITDDIHCDFAHTGHTYTPFGKACPELLDNLVCCYAPSKIFNIAGIKGSAVVIPNTARRDAFLRCQQRLFNDGPCVLGYTAFVAAYRKGATYADEVNAYMEGNARYMVRYMAQHLPMIHTYLPEGTFLSLWDCSFLEREGDDLVRWFAENAGVAFSNGAVYGLEIAHCVRCNLGTTRQQVETVLQRVRQAVDHRV